MWSDIDYMDNYRDFTYSKTANWPETADFPDLAKDVTDLHTANVKYVPIIDAGVALRPNSDYKFYTNLKASGAII